MCIWCTSPGPRMKYKKIQFAKHWKYIAVVIQSTSALSNENSKYFVLLHKFYFFRKKIRNAYDMQNISNKMRTYYLLST